MKIKILTTTTTIIDIPRRIRKDSEWKKQVIELLRKKLEMESEKVPQITRN